MSSAAPADPSSLTVTGKLCPGLFINGAFCAPKDGGTFPDVNPATEATIVDAPAATAADVDAAVAAAAEAFKTWGTTTGAERAVLMRAMAAGVKARKAQLSALETLDSGKPYPEAEWDIDDVSGCLEYYAGLAEALDKRQSSAVDVGDADFGAVIQYDPVGVVAAITPWNYPALMSMWKIAPALAAGCCVVLKPSELAPITSLELAAIASEAGLPPGVLNVLSGTGVDAGAPLVAHPGVDKVAFTGSVATGSRIMARCAEDIRSVGLELGGKSPAIVFDDVDIDKTVEWVMFGCFWTNGQICSATSRLLIQSGIRDKFMARLVEETAKLRCGPPFEKGSQVGPLVSKGQYDKVMAHLEAAKAAGARTLCGGGRPDGFDVGFYVQPTIFDGVTKDMAAWTEEIFGPVLCVMTFDTEAQAVEMANDTEFGLAAAVFTDDRERIARVTRALRVGIVWNNCSQPCFSQLPWGGTKKSGVGRDLGEFGLNNYLEPKQVCTYVSPKPFGWYMKPAEAAGDAAGAGSADGKTAE